MIFLIGILATFFTPWSTVPQIRKSLNTKNTDDVSKWLIICLTGGLPLWIAYGVLKGDMIIAVANSIGISLNLCLLFLKWKYSSKAKRATMQKNKN
jgi:MtN3 and saliva related transmembrane protein